MTLSEQYQRHAFHDLIEEAEKQGIEIGVKAERKRIVKLLKPYAKHNELCEIGCYPEDCSAFSYQNAIKLIKGKRK